jgi:hypothetical protein
MDIGRYYIEVLETGYKVEDIRGGNEIVLKKEGWVVSDIKLRSIQK